MRGGYIPVERGYIPVERGYIFVMKIVATIVSASSQGQRTHSARSKMLRMQMMVHSDEERYQNLNNFH